MYVATYVAEYVIKLKEGQGPNKDYTALLLTEFEIKKMSNE